MVAYVFAELVISEKGQLTHPFPSPMSPEKEENQF